MAVIRLERLPLNIPISDKNGRPQTAFSRWWDQVLGQIEDNLQLATDAQGSADGAQSTADAAKATADAAKATADALDASINVAPGKVLTVNKTMTLDAAADGNALNIGAGGTLGTAAFTAATDYLARASNLSDVASVATARSNLGVSATGADTNYCWRANNLSDVNAAAARTNLGLGTAAVKNTGTSGNTVPLLDGANTFSGTQTIFTTSAADWIVRLYNAYATTPFGLAINYTAASPNGTSSFFLNCVDNVGARVQIYSNGGIANYSANNVNLSDAAVKTDIAPYGDAELDALETAFKAVDWGRFKYADQTHDDWNHGYTAQGVEAAFAGVAPELVDETDLGPEARPGVPKRKAVYDADLTHIGMALLARALKRIEALEARLA